MYNHEKYSKTIKSLTGFKFETVYGYILQECGILSKAIEMYVLSAENNEEISFYENIFILTNAGHINLQFKDNTEALYNYKLALAIAQQINDKEIENLIRMAITNISNSPI